MVRSYWSPCCILKHCSIIFLIPLVFWEISFGDALSSKHGIKVVDSSISSAGRQTEEKMIVQVDENSRRSFIRAVGFAPVVTAFADPALAAAPITTSEPQNLGNQVRRFLRPKPLKILRSRLDKDFAVLLMRASYNTLDELDCVAMEQFQRDFFIIRQAEYEPYVKSLGPGYVQQGDLTDPYYFDFISFAQYATINREISQDPPLVFEEKQPVEVGEGEPQQFVTRVVRRDPSITNDRLASEHSRRVGKAILDRLEETFANTGSALPKIPPGSRPSAEQVLESLSQLVNLFLVNGFAFGGTAAISSLGKGPTSVGTEFCLTLVSPATVWGMQSLQQQRAQLQNDFLLKTAKELVNRYGYRASSTSIKFEGTKELSFLTIQ